MFGETEVINVSSGYGANTKEPYVQILWGNKQLQMSPENARDLAMNLLQAAEAAYSDAYIFEFAKGFLKGGHELTAVMLGEFRKWRETEQDW